jgi:hypothetical protein
MNQNRSRTSFRSIATPKEEPVLSRLNFDDRKTANQHAHHNIDHHHPEKSEKIILHYGTILLLLFFRFFAIIIQNKSTTFSIHYNTQAAVIKLSWRPLTQSEL